MDIWDWDIIFRYSIGISILGAVASAITALILTWCGNDDAASVVGMVAISLVLLVAVIYIVALTIVFIFNDY